MKKEDIKSLYQAIDNFDTKSFATYLDDEANFKFGNMPVVSGKDAIFEFVAGFFQAIKAISHTNLEIWEIEGIRFVNATVTYTRLDGSTLTVNFSNTFKLKGEKIKDYLIFIDNSELFKAA
ncbi:MAG TPA: nuclear transport factor 2 family protein [Bacteroides sp.]|nr:nuclear transport factor 2 family protein [Bacteroides sp.]